VAVRRALLVTPIRPGLMGSGLALRAAAWQRALAAVADVHTLVVPVADPGAAGSTAATATTIADLPDAAALQAGAIRAMAQPALRAAMATYDVDLPAVLSAPPWLGAQHTMQLADGEPFDVIVCFRAYLAPFVAGLCAAAPALATTRLIIDLDDDDAAYHRSRGEHHVAEQYDHLVAALPARALLTAAGRHRAAAARTLPNCVELPDVATARPVAGRVLLVGNLTYAPNIDAVDWYLRDVHPTVAAAVPAAHVRLIGRGGQQWAEHEGVQVAGLVKDLAPEYAAAATVMAPVRMGSGTRIKVLEAWAHARPLVATTAAVEGLRLQPGVHALLADSPREFADAVIQALTDADLAASLAAAGRAHVAQHYGSAVFDRAVAALVDPS
jgi:hypothetical protein